MKILKSNDARDLILKGCNELNDCMKVTLGPKGRYVVIKGLYDEPLVTNDGYTIASKIVLDEGERAGADFLFDACDKANYEIGDSTTTTPVIATKLINESLKYINSDILSSPVKIKEEIEAASEKVLTELEKLKSDKVSILDVASLSAKDKEMGKLIAEVMEEEHEVVIEDSGTYDTYYEIDGGFKIDSGSVSSYFLHNGSISYDDAFVVLSDKKLTSVNDFIDVIKSASNEDVATLFVADDYDVLFTGTMINLITNGHKIVLIKAPGYGKEREEILRDIASITGAKVNGEPGRTSFKCDMNKTIFIGGDATERVAELKQIKTDNEFDKKHLESRINRLSGGIATIYVGGKTSTEQKERKSRFLDAVSAAKSAKDGVVPGGGVALLRVSEKLTDETLGEKFVKAAIREPFMQLCENSGLNPKEILEMEDGYDFKENKFVNSLEAGIVDSYNSIKGAFEFAVSAAKNAILLEVLAYQEKEKKDV